MTLNTCFRLTQTFAVPKVLALKVISPSELRKWHLWDVRRRIPSHTAGDAETQASVSMSLLWTKLVAASHSSSR